MCGIFGIYFFNSERPVNLKMVKDATDTLSHRGPDDSGYLLESNVGIGHRRLSIIDLSAGHQPMSNEDDTVFIVYNGEIYNYQEIKIDLISRGHVFKTDCDTEVIVHAYEEWGTECLHKFNGMFAFVIFDKLKRCFWVVRDRLGVKPLYYYADNQVFIVASEVKAILKTGIVKSRLNKNVLDAYFSVGYVPGPETMFLGVKKVLPGHYLNVNPQGISHYEYWDFADIHTEEVDEPQALEKIEALLIDCVQKRLISDVPIGAFLSGGLDSSVVVALMSRLLAPQPVNTFTVAYHNGYSEKDYAQTVAEQFNTDHHVFYLESDNFFSSLETLVHFAEEPIVEPAAIALYHVSKLARRHAIVLLSGEGSDEVFAGYFIYQMMRKIDMFKQNMPGLLFSIIRLASRCSPNLKYKKYLDWCSQPLSWRYRGTSSYLTPSLKRMLYHPDFLHDKSSYLDNQFFRYFDKIKNKDSLSQMLYVDVKTWLVDNLLIKADKMTMAASIELRVPFLDYRLIEAVSALPANLKIKSGEGKYLLKKIAEKFLPKKIIYRKKMGFPVPTGYWFKEDLMPQIADRLDLLKKEPWFRANFLDTLFVRHMTGKEDQSRLLMSLLVFSEWQQQYG